LADYRYGAGKWITTTNDAGGKLCLEIADTGMGIESEALRKIFDAFEQGGRT
jgi:signal transduction histidine kinase